MPKRRKPVSVMTIRRSTTVARVSADHLEAESFADYLDKLLTIAQLRNTEVEKLTGVDNRTIAKWRKGVASPTIPQLRRFADGMKLPRATLFIRAGLLEPGDVGVDDLYL